MIFTTIASAINETSVQGLREVAEALELLEPQREAMWFIRPFAWFFGMVLDFIYNILYSITSTDLNTLGFAIILLTVISRLIVLPLTLKGQKSMMAMQSLQPEIEKLRAKYPNKKDMDEQKKMQAEMSKLQRDNGVSMTAGCLPMLIQMPIFMGLYNIMINVYHYISRIDDIYDQMTEVIMSVPGYWNYFTDVMYRLDEAFVVHFANADHVNVLTRILTPYEWDTLVANVPTQHAAELNMLLHSRANFANFLGLNLFEGTSWAWPGILVPILAAVTTFLTSYLMQIRAPKSSDPSVAMQKKMMMFFMPAFMGFITFGLPAGVGLYWIAGNIMQVFQQIWFNKKYMKNA